ncbi:acyl-CoA thioesterase [Pectinatus sottacetonis]|uniref:acyl-CoA thioesterase n=1 Tax=Pectinatus sottacetonis TaxID=1002795 RepID=UPI0018C7DE7D
MITEVTHRVNFFDTDAMAVVHHANYIKWFEIGRVDFLRKNKITLTEIMADGYIFPITNVSAKYISSAHYDEVLVIKTIPTALTKAKMEFNYEIYRQCDSAVLVKGYTQNVFTHRDTGKITRLPEKYYNRLQQALN